MITELVVLNWLFRKEAYYEKDCVLYGGTDMCVFNIWFNI